jgi:hypothetical protein
MEGLCGNGNACSGFLDAENFLKSEYQIFKKDHASWGWLSSPYFYCSSFSTFTVHTVRSPNDVSLK